MAAVFIGTAGWFIRKEHQSLFPAADSVPEKYANLLNAVETNSTFYKNPLAKTYIRWSESVPDDFRYSIKLLKVYTHQNKLLLVDVH